MPGESATGTWTLSGDEWFFGGHFPGRPTLPGVLMCEAIAQVGALAVLTDERFAGKLPLFGGLDGARFRRQVGPGDTLTLEVSLGRMSARAGKGSGRALLGADVAVLVRPAVRRRRRLIRTTTGRILVFVRILVAHGRPRCRDRDGFASVCRDATPAGWATS